MRRDMTLAIRPGAIRPGAIRSGAIRPGAIRPGAIGATARGVSPRAGTMTFAAPRSMRFASRSQGFTLLETMVALVIFTGAAMALYALFNTNLLALTRAHDVSRQTPALRNAVEYIASINPREAGDGRIELDGLDVVWSATLVQPPRQSQTLTGGRGYFEIGLYEIEFTMSDRGRPLGTWRMRSVGYEKVRHPDL